MVGHEMKTLEIVRGVALCLCLAACAGSPPPDSLGRCASGATQAVTLHEVPMEAGDASQGAQLFAASCAKCHAQLVSERSSRLFRGYPRLDCDAYLDRASDAYLWKAIASGGSSVGLDEAMKPFDSQLTPGQIADLIAYLRSQR